MMDWRKHISTLSPEIKFNPPARPEEIRDAEAKLNVVFPESLKELWSQSNGLIDHYEGWFVWSTDEIVKRNMEMRTFPGFEGSFMPFDPLLFFGMTEAATYTFSRYAAARSNTSSCFDGTTKPTAEYWKSTISKRTSTSLSLHPLTSASDRNSASPAAAGLSSAA
jgi:hypothetical protein